MKEDIHEVAQAFVDEGIAESWDDAIHMLYDMGEIDSSDHEELLSEEEAERVYGS